MIRSMQETQDGGYLPVDCDEILEKRRRGMPMDKLWAVYAKDAERLGKAAYRRSRFCEIVADYASGKGIAVSIEKVPGIKCEVDWVGDKAHIIDVDTGELIPVHIFVIALPYSSYFYCEGFFDERMGSWLAGHMHGFEFFGGVVPLPSRPSGKATLPTTQDATIFSGSVIASSAQKNPRRFSAQ